MIRAIYFKVIDLHFLHLTCREVFSVFQKFLQLIQWCYHDPLYVTIIHCILAVIHFMLTVIHCMLPVIHCMLPWSIVC